jgi:predicted CXXCH cytochrome family protein
MSKHRRPARRTSSLGKRDQKIIAIVAALFVLGLATMFTATRFENHDSFCASCHTEGEHTFFNRSLTTPVDLASYHTTKSTRCIDCHTGPGVTGRFWGLMAGASDLVSYFSGHYPQPAVQDNPITDDHCMKCHANLLQNQDFNNHFHLYLAQWQALDPQNAGTCVSCHNGHNTNGDAKIMYLNEQDTTAVCQKCHTTVGGG